MAGDALIGLLWSTAQLTVANVSLSPGGVSSIQRRGGDEVLFGAGGRHPRPGVVRRRDVRVRAATRRGVLPPRRLGPRVPQLRRLDRDRRSWASPRRSSPRMCCDDRDRDRRRRLEDRGVPGRRRPPARSSSRSACRPAPTMAARRCSTECIELAAHARRVRRRLAATQLPLGVGVCELVSPAGVITSAATFDWRGVDLTRRVRPPRRRRVRRAGGRDRRGATRRGRGAGPTSSTSPSAPAWRSASIIGGAPYVGARGNALILGAPPVETTASGAALSRLRRHGVGRGGLRARRRQPSSSATAAAISAGRWRGWSTPSIPSCSSSAAVSASGTTIARPRCARCGRASRRPSRGRSASCPPSSAPTPARSAWRCWRPSAAGTRRSASARRPRRAGRGRRRSARGPPRGAAGCAGSGTHRGSACTGW